MVERLTRPDDYEHDKLKQAMIKMIFWSNLYRFFIHCLEL